MTSVSPGLPGSTASHSAGISREEQIPLPGVAGEISPFTGDPGSIPGRNPGVLPWLEAVVAVLRPGDSPALKPDEQEKASRPEVVGPFFNFPMENPVGKDIFLLGGGSGDAQILS